MFDPDDLVPCGQCGCSVQFSDLNNQSICSDCVYDNHLIEEATVGEPQWLDESPAHWMTSATTFSSS